MKNNSKNFLIFSSLIVSLNGFAQDCGSVKDGDVKRLDAPGGPLEKAHVQDQDGLGTCYANTASLMLQSALAGNPEVSYLQIAINKAEQTNAQTLRQQGKRQAFSDKGDLLLDAGFSCESINLAKKTGGVCARGDVALEQLIFDSKADQFLDNNWVQLDLLKKVSTYYDGMLKTFGTDTTKPLPVVEKKSNKGFFASIFKKDPVDPNNNEKTGDDPEAKNEESVDTDKFREYKNALKTVIDKNRDNYAKKECMKVDARNAESVAANMMLRLQNKLASRLRPQPGDSSLSALRYKMGFIAYGKSNGIATMEPGLSDKMKTTIAKDYFNNMTKTNPAKSGVEAFRGMIKNFASGMPPAILDSVMKDLSRDDIAMLESDYNRYALKDFSGCINKGRLQYMKSDDGLVKDFKGTCNGAYLAHVQNLQEMIIGLDKFNFDNIDRLNGFISNLPNLTYDQAMMKLLAPSCTDDKKIKIPADLKCNSKSIYMSSEDKSTPEKEAQFLTKAKQDFFETAQRNFTGNKAIGLSMCTSFWDQTSTDAFYNKDSVCDPNKKHGFHAVTMIGYKCDKGELKYLIQNSWGSWDSANTRFEKDSYGKSWMKADELIKNTYQMDLME